MTMRELAFVLGIGVASLGGQACSSGPHVVLNEIAYSLPSGQAEGQSCWSADLGQLSGDGTPSWIGADQSSALFVREASGDEAIVISVTQKHNILAQKAYNATFFATTKSDEFTATAVTGDSLLVQLWGHAENDGPLVCDPGTGPFPAP
jgi:hypothetical protein